MELVCRLLTQNDSAKFLTEEERTEVQARLKLDRTSLADEYDSKYLFAALKDWKIYLHMLITIGNSFLVLPGSSD